MWKLNLLRVNPEMRGRGIATSLIQHTEDLARHSNIPQLHLSVEESGPVKLYENMGYTKYRRAGGHGQWSETSQGRILTSENGNTQVVFDLYKSL